MDALLPFIVADVAVVLTVAALSFKRLTFFHPLTYYLFFHSYAFTLRTFELYAGKYPMYYGLDTHAYYSAIVPDEFIRALIVSDVALILFAAGCFAASIARLKPRMARPFNDGLLRNMLIALLPLSFVLLTYRRFGGADAQDAVETGYKFVSIIGGVWPIALVGLAIARYGFKWPWILAATIYLAMVGTQGYHRFQLLLPIIMLFGIYLARRRNAWPGPAAWGVLFAAAIIFPSLKPLGAAFEKGGFAAAVETVTTSQRELSDPYASRTEMFFDQFAGSLTLTDALGSPLLGETYVAILTLPVPRTLWPGKPSLGAAAINISAPGRPYQQEGRIVTVIGESYLNFRYVGIILIMSALGYVLTRYYLKAFSIPEVDPYKVAYIGFTTAYLQVFRDGLPSIVLFSLIAMTPLYLFVVLNRLGGRSPAFPTAASALPSGS